MSEAWEGVRALARAIRANVEKVIAGKTDAVDLAVTILMARGHLLIEDVPGVGKTMLARAMAASVGASVHRIQFTPDLLPSDVTGASIYNQASRQFVFDPGPVFANIVIADEINRASPKAQSALLECMEEDQVTVDGQTHPLPQPFHVIATQNPIDMDGTFALLEAQRDRFMARLSMGYPSADDEWRLVDDRHLADPVETLRPVANLDSLVHAMAWCSRVHIADALTGYAIAIVRATRQHAAFRLGASPRASVHLVAAAKARAACRGRGHVLPDDIDALAGPILSHRLMPASPGRGLEQSERIADAIDAIVGAIPVPLFAE